MCLKSLLTDVTSLGCVHDATVWGPTISVVKGIQSVKIRIKSGIVYLTDLYVCMSGIANCEAKWPVHNSQTVMEILRWKN